MTNEEWGPWIEHDGKGCPCVGSYVHMIYSDDASKHGIALGGASWFYGDVDDWSTWLNGFRPIIRYRIRKPRAMKLLQSIVENPPKQLVKEDA